MRNILTTLAAIAVVAALGGPAWAEITLNVDTGPNVYGSPNWAPWWAAAKADVAAGSFVNMRSGAFPGTTVFTPYEEIVYSTGDLGRRLMFIYWIPNTSVAQLQGKFEIKFSEDWDGVQWALDATNNWVLDTPEAGWKTPKNWEDYNGGVIGCFGCASWADDDLADPHSTYGSIYDETDQADIDAQARLLLASQSNAIGSIRFLNVDGNWDVAQLEANMVPEPSSFVLASGLGALGLVVARRKRKTAVA